MALDETAQLAAQLPKTPISIRLSSELAPEVARRLSQGEAPASVVRRDLQRYYAGCNDALRRLAITYTEANLLVEFLQNTTLTPELSRFLWAEVDEQLRRRAKRFPEGSAEHDQALGLIEQLRSASPFDCIAILDAVESYWCIYFRNGNDRDDALALSGLTLEHLEWEAHYDAQQERADGNAYEDRPEHDGPDQ